jgi:phospholipid/cholesterol/gamma-HCH transport system substrate-binding protein
MMLAMRKHVGDVIALVLLFVVAVGVAGYILDNQRLRFPLVEEKPFVLEAELADAQAVQPGQGQTVRVAGIEIGQIGKVELEDGLAVVELELEPKYEGFIKDDATALLRSKTGLKDMFLEVDPGEGEALEDGDRIQVANSAPDVDPDEFLSALDSDTRDYLRMLITGAGKGLDNGGGKDLQEALARLGPLHRDLASVSGAVARRRDNLERLVNRYGLLMTELGSGREDIQRLVRASDQALGAFADEEQDLSGFVARLPGALRESRTALAKLDRLSDTMQPALNALRPPFRKLDDANAELLPLAREGTPIVRDEIRPFARASAPFIRDLGTSSEGLTQAAPDFSKSLLGLNRLFNIGAYNPEGSEGISDACENGGTCTAEERARNEGYMYWLAWVAQNTVSVFSTADAQGPFRRASLGGVSCGTLQGILGTTGVPNAVIDLVAGNPTSDGLLQTLGACGS